MEIRQEVIPNCGLHQLPKLTICCQLYRSGKNCLTFRRTVLFAPVQMPGHPRLSLPLIPALPFRHPRLDRGSLQIQMPVTENMH